MGGLIGREREVARLRSLLDRAFSDAVGGVTLIRGEAGIGKTTLARWVAAAARAEGACVLFGRAHPHSSLVSYGPVVEALGRELRELPERELEALTGRIVGLSVLFPGLVFEPELLTLPDDLALTRTLEAIRALLVRLAADGPVLFVVDDVQWADAATLRTLVHLAGELEGAPLVVVLTMRDGKDADRPDMRATLSALRRVTPIDELVPARLDATETARMLAEVAGEHVPPEIIAEVVERSAGTPLFVEALGRKLLDRGWSGEASVPIEPPAAVADAIGERLDGLTADAVSVLAVVALAGRELDLAGARRVSEFAETSFDAALSELLSRHLVTTGERAGTVFIETAHPVIAEVVESRLTPMERSRLHLALLNDLSPDTDSEIAAIHVLGAADRVDPMRAIDVLSAAADQAALRQAHRSVAAHAGRAFDLARAEGLVEAQLVLADRLGAALFALGEIDAAEAVTDDALAVDAPNQRMRLPALMRAETFAWLRGSGEAEVTEFERALAAIPADDMGPDIVRALEHRLTLHARRKNMIEMQASADDLRRRLEGNAEPYARSMYLIGEAYQLELEHRSAAVLRVLDEVVELSLANELTERLHRARVVALDATMLTGPVPAVRAAIAAVTGQTAPLYVTWRDHIVDHVCGLAELDPGWREVGETAPSPFGDGSGRQPHWPNPVVAAHRAWIEADLAGVDDVLAAAPPPGRSGSSLSESERAAIEGYRALLAGDVDAGRAALVSLLDRPVQAVVELLLEDVTARLAVMTGDADVLAMLLLRLRGQDDGAGWASAHADMIEAMATGDAREAGRRFLHAADRFAAMADRRQEAGCLTAAAEHDPDLLDRSRVRALLTQVERAGLDGLAQRMRAVLGDVDEPSPRPATLTARQLEIAELVAEGLTNAAIADRLFISVRTVTSHLDHIYTRLDITNRTELAMRLPALR